MLELQANDTVEIRIDAREHTGVGLALQDLIHDLGKVMGIQGVRRKYLSDTDGFSITVGTLSNIAFGHYLKKIRFDFSSIDGKKEHYFIKSVGEEGRHLVIAGSDTLAAIYGIYEFSRVVLGVNPLHLWTGHEAATKENLDFGSISLSDGPNTFDYRGWFINDEDLLLGWTGKFDNDFQNNAFTKHAGYADALEPIMETALRLKQNLLIPCSLLDILDPSDEDLVRRVTERGLFISQHHIEPLGVFPKRVLRYWQERGDDSPLSYTKNPEKYEEVWKLYASRWARYDNVVWQLGLRGMGDKPVWEDDPYAPDTECGRGQLITDAIAKQREIIAEALGHDNFASTATLWMEGMELLKGGHLSFPTETIIIHADFGPTQMLGDSFYEVQREPDRQYGIYYHVAFWSCGPHLVQGTLPDKIYYNLHAAVQKGNTDYLVVNVTNLREMLLGTQCTAAMGWNFEAYQPESFIQDWTIEHYGQQGGLAAAQAYQAYFAAFHSLDDSGFDGRMLLMDGMCRRLTIKLVALLNGQPFTKDKVQNKTLMDFSQAADFVDYYKRATAVALPKWDFALNEAYNALQVIDESRRDFFTSNLLVQLSIIRALYRAVHHLSVATEAMLSGSTKDASLVRGRIIEAVAELQQASIIRLHAERDQWKGWYDGDVLLNLPDLIRQVMECAGSFQQMSGSRGL
ncbi:glycosyl hydrolase 115 family protein [Paenibacillus sp. YIM B09110]|uniref:glycosyl hydrolase 115 family protein n=1 Tax=Paenibacillus sp. YIM B09110 TaxID=3126102 RepID=UPI00301E4478